MCLILGKKRAKTGEKKKEKQKNNNCIGE